MRPNPPTACADLALIRADFAASYQETRSFELEPYMALAQALGIDHEEARGELLNVALRLADEENDCDSLDRLSDSLRSDGTPWFTAAERRPLLTNADRISEKADREAREAQRDASEGVRERFIARLLAGRTVSDVELVREVEAGRLHFEHFCTVRTARAALQAGHRQTQP